MMRVRIDRWKMATGANDYAYAAYVNESDVPHDVRKAWHQGNTHVTILDSDLKTNWLFPHDAFQPASHFDLPAGPERYDAYMARVPQIDRAIASAALTQYPELAEYLVESDSLPSLWIGLPEHVTKDFPRHSTAYVDVAI